jgi:hypothetical protein
MGHMPAEPPPIDLDTPPPQAVVEFGPEPAPRRRWSTAGLGRSLAADRRLVPVAAALGAVAVLASLVSEWQVTTIDATINGGGEVGQRLLPTDVTDLGAIGTGYLVGLFPLVVIVILTLFGPSAGRRHLRLAGLSVGGTMLALLVAATASLAGESRALPRIWVLQLNDDGIVNTYGRGLWCAFAGVLLALLALHLADRHLPVGGDDAAVDDPPAVWTWRRGPGSEDERGRDEERELTVAPAQPFTTPPPDRDKPTPSGRGGYPGDERTGPPVA